MHSSGPVLCILLAMLMKSNRRFGLSLSITEKALYLVTTVASMYGNFHEDFYLDSGPVMLGYRCWVRVLRLLAEVSKLRPSY